MQRLLSSSTRNILSNRAASLQALYHSSHDVDGYDLLMDRFDHCVIPLTNNDILEEIMRSVLSEEQATFLSRVPGGFVFKSEMYEKFSEEIDEMMESLFSIGYLYENNDYFFNFPEMVIGWWEWFWMKDPDFDFPREKLAELSKEYIFNHFVPKIGELAEYPNDMVRNFRTLVREEEVEPKIEILDYESAERLIKQSQKVAAGLCGCQTNENHIRPEAKLDEKYPIKRCLVFDWESNKNASCLEKFGIVEFITHEEALEILENGKDLGLVQNCDNSTEASFMCQCPKDVCYMFRAYNDKTLANAMCPSRFIASWDPEACVSCGMCVDLCVSNSYFFVEDEVKFEDDYCLGCGVCSYICQEGAVEMVMRDEEELEKIFVPQDTLSKNLYIARDMRQIHSYLFGDQEKCWHRWAGQLMGGLEKSGLGKRLLSYDTTLNIAKKLFVANLERRIRKEKKKEK